MKIQLAFYKGRGKLIDTLIRWYTKSKYSHVELHLGDNLFFSADAWTGVVRYTTFKSDPSNWDFIDFEITDQEHDTVLSLCNALCGKSYDYMGVFKFVLPFLKGSEDKWYCSEVCHMIIQRIGKTRSTRPHRGPDPGELYQLFR